MVSQPRSMFSNPESSFVLGSSDTWTTSWIVAICVILTYFIASQGTSADQRKLEKPQHRRMRGTLSQAKKVKAAMLREQHETERYLALTRTQKPFPFMKLPQEIQLLILSPCADWNRTYKSLVLVSRTMQQLTLEACLPRMPVILLTMRACTIFSQFLFTHPEAENLVRHLFIWPPEDTGSCMVPCATILLRCKNSRTLACTPVMLHLAMRAGMTVTSHHNCTDFTLLPGTEGLSSTLHSLPDDDRIRAFLEGLTHLRVPSGDYYAETSNEVVSNDKRYPMVRTIIVTLRQSKLQHVRVTKKKGTQFFSFEVTNRWTEVEIWRRNAQERGIWAVVNNWQGYREKK
ncbi:hypothetical protein BDQ17DRAFT_1377006 [Cyathus striatus]|nr:hypothetical protein BDQ17DRAFT_1377006 [Cyathus striatus]